ncbi:hypothetical protein NQ318_007540 [Aromia moschata]|uniref:Uncharacterized protein n=1 Tax=Aromia moschata TaxID=1265417 RepID=A0AAV8YCR0_9CUCU|nr:hypothetical protein NQ318_007540 [Aromia moschata]
MMPHMDNSAHGFALTLNLARHNVGKYILRKLFSNDIPSFKRRELNSGRSLVIQVFPLIIFKEYGGIVGKTNYLAIEDYIK